jgi:hypothetical protein
MADYEPTIGELIQEEQAARIRWLLERAAPEVQFEFAFIYVPGHPFPTEGSADHGV